MSDCNPMDYSTPGFPVHHQLPELTQTHVHWVGDAIQPSRPLLSPSRPLKIIFLKIHCERDELSLENPSSPSYEPLFFKFWGTFSVEFPAVNGFQQMWVKGGMLSCFCNPLSRTSGHVRATERTDWGDTQVVSWKEHRFPDSHSSMELPSSLCEHVTYSHVVYATVISGFFGINSEPNPNLGQVQSHHYENIKDFKNWINGKSYKTTLIMIIILMFDWHLTWKYSKC